MLIAFFFILAILLDLIATGIASRVARKRYLRRKEVADCVLPVTKTGINAMFKEVVIDYMDSLIRYQLRLLGGFPSHRIRNLILSHIYGMRIGKNVVIYGGFEIRSPWNICIGEGSIIGDESKLDGRNEIVIGKHVNFSTGVWIGQNSMIFKVRALRVKVEKLKLVIVLG